MYVLNDIYIIHDINIQYTHDFIFCKIHILYIGVHHILQDCMAPFFPMDILICSLLSTTIIPGRLLDPLLQVIEDVFVHLHVDVGSASPIKEDPHQLLC